MRTRSLLALAALACGRAATAQAPPQVPNQDPQQAPKQQGEKNADDVEDLKFRVESLEKALADSQARALTASPQRSNVFNPGITVFGNFLARADDQHVYLEDDPTLDRIDDRLLLREFEVDFRAAIDPWADGVFIGTFEAETPGDFEASVEEGYLTLKKLPILDTAPAGLKLKAGRFRAEFGRFNYIHLHDLPQPTYPRSLQTFLGDEGYIQDGISGQFFLPSPSDTQTIEATAQILDGGDIPLADGTSGSDVAMLAHLKWFDDLGEGRSVEVGASGWEQNSDRRLFGVDATYKWKPFVGGEWRSFLIGGELYTAALDDPALSSSPTGWYLWSQYQFNRSMYLGLRFDQAEELADESLVTNTYGAFLTYYTTEFLRFRLGAEHADSDLDVQDGRNTAFLEVNLVFGSHPVEPYWVNR